MTSKTASAPAPPPHRAVVLGASAGGVEALSVVLGGIPPTYPRAILVVIHLPPHRPSVLVDLFDAKCSLPVREASDKEPVNAGAVYFAPPDYHLLVDRGPILALSKDEPVYFSRPSIDVLFESAADVYGPNLAAVILSGASGDGAEGLARVLSRGGVAAVQDPDTAVARRMPEEAAARNGTACVLPLDGIAPFLLELDGGAP
jgi:two-component system, chemotaxis family, protein-glutamate methylesterase/glutaminase